MRMLRRREDGAGISLSDDELDILIAGLGEALYAIEDWEVETQAGSRREEMTKVLNDNFILVIRGGDDPTMPFFLF